MWGAHRMICKYHIFVCHFLDFLQNEDDRGRCTNIPDGLPPHPDLLVPPPLPSPPFCTGCPSWHYPPNLSWLVTCTKYAGLRTQWLGSFNVTENGTFSRLYVSFHSFVKPPLYHLWDKVRSLYLHYLRLCALGSHWNLIVLWRQKKRILGPHCILQYWLLVAWRLHEAILI